MSTATTDFEIPPRAWPLLKLYLVIVCSMTVGASIITHSPVLGFLATLAILIVTVTVLTCTIPVSFLSYSPRRCSLIYITLVFFLTRAMVGTPLWVESLVFFTAPSMVAIAITHGFHVWRINRWTRLHNASPNSRQKLFHETSTWVHQYFHPPFTP